MARLVASLDEFAETWNAADSASRVAEITGLTAIQVSNLASRLRRQCVQLKRFNAQCFSTCEACHQDFPASPSIGRRFCSRECSKNCNKTHGDTKSRLYSIWKNMKSRCRDSSSPAYEYYGGRGIAVCQKWRDSYEAFRDWALANGYRKSLEIDRKDVNGNYEPSNCRWATRIQQMHNTRKPRDAQTSKFKGVSRTRRNGKWRVQITRCGKNTFVGDFDDETQAARVYDSVAKDVYGEYAVLNFPT